MKLVVTILVGMNITLLIWYCQLDQRLTLNSLADKATFSAQNEAFGVHAKAINQLTRIVVGLSEALN